MRSEHMPVYSGFRAIDTLTGGFQPGELIVVGSRPAFGKTSFLMSTAKYLAVDCQLPIVFLNLETSAERMLNRYQLMYGESYYRNVNGVPLSCVMGDTADNSLLELFKSQLIIDACSGGNFTEILDKCRKYKTLYDVRCILIDYLQLMQYKDTVKDNEHAAGEMLTLLKDLAEELKVPVIVAAQLSRNPEHRKDKRPRLSDARGDKKAFEKADTVLLIYRDAWYHYESYDGNSEYVEFILAKHAEGKNGNVQLRFNKNCGRFEEDKEVMAN